MHSIVRFHTEFTIHEETQLFRLLIVSYEEQSFLRGRLYNNKGCPWIYTKSKCFLCVLLLENFKILFLWMLDNFLGARLQPSLLSFLPKIILSIIELREYLHLKHDYDAPHTYNMLSNCVSYLLGSFLLETNSPTASQFEISN